MSALLPYPSLPYPRLAVEGEAAFAGGRLRIAFTVTGAVVLPEADGEPVRRDGLWRTTCFELFARGVGEAYAELNLAPSGDWAAYAFDGYRAGMRDLADMAAPVIACAETPAGLVIDAMLDPAPLVALLGPPPWRIGLSAVIEAPRGTISYWALAHSPEKPDFHHSACFAAELAAPPGA